MAISGLGYFAIETSETDKWHELLTAVLGMGSEQAAGVTASDIHQMISGIRAEMNSTLSIAPFRVFKSSLEQTMEIRRLERE